MSFVCFIIIIFFFFFFVFHSGPTLLSSSLYSCLVLKRYLYSLFICCFKQAYINFSSSSQSLLNNSAHEQRYNSRTWIKQWRGLAFHLLLLLLLLLSIRDLCHGFFFSLSFFALFFWNFTSCLLLSFLCFSLSLLTDQFIWSTTLENWQMFGEFTIFVVFFFSFFFR